MHKLQGSLRPEIGAAGMNRQRARRRRAADMEIVPLTKSEGDAGESAKLPKTSACDQQQRDKMLLRLGDRLGRRARQAKEQARQKATAAAVTAYRKAIRHNGERHEACRAALQAYRELCPDERDLSDRVAGAIMLAIVDPTKG